MAAKESAAAYAARILNDICIRMVEKHEKPELIRALRETFVREYAKANGLKYEGVQYMNPKNYKYEPPTFYIEDEICNWNNPPLK